MSGLGSGAADCAATTTTRAPCADCLTTAGHAVNLAQPTSALPSDVGHYRGKCTVCVENSLCGLLMKFAASTTPIQVGMRSESPYTKRHADSRV